MVGLMVGVKLNVFAKIISVGDGDIGAFVGDGVGVVGDGDKATVGLTIGLTVGEGAFGLGVAVGKTAIVGLINACLRTELFCFIKIKTKITTIIVNKEIIKKTNLE